MREDTIIEKLELDVRKRILTSQDKVRRNVRNCSVSLEEEEDIYDGLNKIAERVTFGEKVSGKWDVNVIDVTVLICTYGMEFL
ncbi:unnamed protein product [Allacma fusca]|uniref:Uncharacterized protein n=1 Tax=Allacma fusca TaxID=39272 RepID=A0A8J2JFD3_9HEXA|nr:unnamed protein product [Allacma fusca]